MLHLLRIHQNVSRLDTEPRGLRSPHLLRIRVVELRWCRDFSFPLKILEYRVAFNPRINCSSGESYPETRSAAKIAHVSWTVTVPALPTSLSQVALEILQQIDFSKQ